MQIVLDLQVTIFGLWKGPNPAILPSRYFHHSMNPTRILDIPSIRSFHLVINERTKGGATLKYLLKKGKYGRPQQRQTSVLKYHRRQAAYYHSTSRTMMISRHCSGCVQASLDADRQQWQPGSCSGCVVRQQVLELARVCPSQCRTGRCASCERTAANIAYRNEGNRSTYLHALTIRRLDEVGPTCTAVPVHMHPL